VTLDALGCTPLPGLNRRSARSLLPLSVSAQTFRIATVKHLARVQNGRAEEPPVVHEPFDVRLELGGRHSAPPSDIGNRKRRIRSAYAPVLIFPIPDASLRSGVRTEVVIIRTFDA
jgi:hypothetical protein